MTKKQAGKSVPKKMDAPKKAALKEKSAPKKKATRAAELEAAMRQIGKMIGGAGLISQGDLSALLFSLQGPSAQDGLSDAEADARHEAQELAFGAMEARTEAQARTLAKRALALDPDCVDALVVLAGIESDSPRKMMEALQKAVGAGERSLGVKFILENKGHFWGLLDTRPYMRALEHLAGLCHAQGFKLDAIKTYEKMLALNPNDNQGARDPLLGLYLAIGGLEEAGKLLKDYEKDPSANFAWARVLERFLSSDLPGAAAALEIARKKNPLVELFLSSEKEMPRYLPEMYSPGSEEEAMVCLDYLAVAWGNFPPAVLWLRGQLRKNAAPKNTPAAKLKIVSAKPGKIRYDQ